MDAPEEDVVQTPHGFASVHPQSGKVVDDTPLHQVLENFIRSHLHFVFFAVVLGYFLSRKLYRKYVDYCDKIPVNGKVDKSRESMTDAQRIALARERQQRLADEASARDAEKKREEERRRLEMEKEKRRIREGKEMEGAGPGRQLGGSAAPSTQPGPAADRRSERNGEEEGNPKKLPKLPGGDRDQYEPFPSGSSEGGSRYRPTGFARPKKG
jgi:hypothetical protein